MKISFNKPIIVIDSNQFKVYCKKRNMKDVFMALKGEPDYF